MTNPLLLLAAAAPMDPKGDLLKQLPPPKASQWFGTEMLLLLGAIALIALVFFIWAFFIRKRGKGLRGSRVLRAPGEDSEARYGSSGRRKHRKRRPDHPDNLPRNPTLSETGGLPPIRPEEPEPSAEPEARPEPPRTPQTR